MSLLAGAALKAAVTASVSGFDPKLLGFDALDVRLSSIFHTENSYANDIELATGQESNAFNVCTASRFTLAPRQFVKAYLVESFHLPAHLSAQFTLRSVMARKGLEQATSIWLKPKWKGNLVLELYNFLTNHNLILQENMPIGQLHFFEVSDG